MTLLDAFEGGTLDPAAFPHRAHVLVSFELAQRYSPDEAYARLVAGLRALTIRAGRPDRFHETITRAWFELIRHVGDPEAHPELFDTRLLARFYSPERLAAGRERFLEPDLAPLRLGDATRISHEAAA
jgi:hypothetical protein